MTKSAKNIPQSTEHERFILGSILIDDSKFASVTGAITEDVFLLQNHKTIWKRMSEMAGRSEKIDYSTLANELLRFGELELAGGLTALVAMTDGLPNIQNLNSYVAIVVEKWRLRKALYVAQKIQTQVISGEYTADEISLNGQAYLADDVGGYGSSQIESARDFVTTFPGGVNLFLDPSRANPGLSTGFRDIDEVCDGFHAGEIFVVGARPASGKTALGCNIAKSVARAGLGVAFFSMELSKTMLLHRLICEEAYVSYSRFRRGGLDDDDRRRVREATQTVMDMPLYIDDTAGLRIADMRVKINRITRTQPIALIVADYAQLIKAPKGQRFNTENDKFTAIGEEIKTLTKSTNIPMLLLSQLNRDSEKDKGDNRPKLSQCRGAGIWEEIAFLGACLYREYFRKRERADLEDKADFLVEKNRSGPVRSVPLRFQSWLMRFSGDETRSTSTADTQPERDPTRGQTT